MTSPKRVPRYIWALFVAWIRTSILRDTFHKARERYLRRAKAHSEAPVPFNRPGLEVLTFLELWFASLQVLVEGYDRSHKHPDSALSNPDVDKLLTPSRRKKLRRFRNTVFHVEFRGHPHTVAVLKEYKEFTEWADTLLTVLGVAIVERCTSSKGSKVGQAATSQDSKVGESLSRGRS
jgi:hypothetical protein